MMRLLFVLAAITSATTFAEAGLAPTLCGNDAGCECGTNTCGCGEVCQGSCRSGVVVFCTSDSQCFVPCGSFVCEMNRCVPGSGGGGGGAGGGGAGGGGGGGGGGAGGGGGEAGGSVLQPPITPVRGCGCATTPPFLLGAAIASLLLRRRVKLCPQRDSNSR